MHGLCAGEIVDKCEWFLKFFKYHMFLPKLSSGYSCG